MSYELLQELRDISSMAVEHFKEHIDPTMKRIQMINNAIRNNSSRFIRCVADADDSDSESTLPSPSSSSSCPPMVNMASRTLNSFVRSSCASPSSSPNSSLSSSIKIELVVQQNRLLINSQKRQIVDLKTKVIIVVWI
jgi:F-box protein 28